MIELPHSPSDATALVNELKDSECLRTLAEVSADAGPALAHLRRIRGTEDEQHQIDLIREAWALPQPSDTLSGFGRVRQIAPLRWDMRHGESRLMIPTSVELLPTTWLQSVRRCAQEFAMNRESTARGAFDLVVILGGLVSANQMRPLCAKRLLDLGPPEGITTTNVVALAGWRMIDSAEQELAEKIGTEGMHERRSLAEGMMRAFGTTDGEFNLEVPADGPSRKKADVSEGYTIQILTAPAMNGAAPTARECLEWLFTSSVDLPSRLDRILCITSPMYRIHKHLDLLQALSMAGVEAEAVTIGCLLDPPGYPLPRRIARGQHYLHELLEVVRSVERFDETAHQGATQVGPGALVVSHAQVLGSAKIRGNAAVGGRATIRDQAYVGGNALVADRAQISGNARVSESAEIEAGAQVTDRARVFGRARVVGDSRVGGQAQVSGRAWIGGHSELTGECEVKGDACIGGTHDTVQIKGQSVVTGHVDIDGNVEIGGEVIIFGAKDNLGDHMRIQGPDDPGLRLLIDGRARLSGTVRIKGNGHVGGSAFITGHAFIGEDCEILLPRHVQTLTLNDNGTVETVTIHRTSGGRYRVYLGDSLLDTEGLETMPGDVKAAITGARILVGDAG